VLEEDNRTKDKLIRWYKGELEAVVDEQKREFIATNRHKVFYKVIKSTARGEHQEDTPLRS
jgi:hypothetical protein